MNEKTESTIDLDGQWIYRVGGISAFVLVIGYFATFPLYASVGIEPTGAEPRLIHYAPHLTEWWAILGLMVFTDLLYAPIWLALYRALKGIGRTMMVLAFACQGLFVVLDLVITWINHAVLFNLSRDYAMTANDIQRAVIVSSAGAATTVLNSIMLAVIAILIPSLGILLSGIVMLKGNFGKGVAYLSFMVGITGVLAAFGPTFTHALDTMHIINALLATVWYLLVGGRLHKLAQQTHTSINQAAFASN